MLISLVIILLIWFRGAHLRTLDTVWISLWNKVIRVLSLVLDAFTSPRCGFLGWTLCQMILVLLVPLYILFLISLATCSWENSYSPSCSNNHYVCVSNKLDLNVYSVEFSLDRGINLNFLLANLFPTQQSSEPLLYSLL